MKKIIVMFMVVFIGFYAGKQFISYLNVNKIDSTPNSINSVNVENINSNAKDIDNKDILLVNKDNGLSKDYIPDNLVKVDIPSTNTIRLTEIAGNALDEMFAGAKKDNINLLAVSGYRSYNDQKSIYNRAVSTNQPNVSFYYAKPGYSEHQTGLAADVVSNDFQKLLPAFRNTDSYKWMLKNCSKYGFIVRYPKNKTDITKYNFEPWHIRYVGKEVAEEIMDNELTLEEYLNR